MKINENPNYSVVTSYKLGPMIIPNNNLLLTDHLISRFGLYCIFSEFLKLDFYDSLCQHHTTLKYILILAALQAYPQ